MFQGSSPPPEKPTNEAWIHWFINFESADVLIIPTPIFWGNPCFIWRGSKSLFLFSHHNHSVYFSWQVSQAGIPTDTQRWSFRKTSVRSWNGSPAVCRKRSYKTFWRMLICILGLPRKSSHLSTTGSQKKWKDFCKHWDDCPVRDGPVPCQSSSVWLYSPTFDPWNT